MSMGLRLGLLAFRTSPRPRAHACVSHTHTLHLRPHHCFQGAFTNSPCNNRVFFLFTAHSLHTYQHLFMTSFCWLFRPAPGNCHSWECQVTFASRRPLKTVSRSEMRMLCQCWSNRHHYSLTLHIEREQSKPMSESLHRSQMSTCKNHSSSPFLTGSM